MQKMFLLCSLLWFASFASAAPRGDVEGIAATIEAHYFDPSRAAAIASELRQRAAAGDFDRYKQRNDLAVELTQRLRKLDGHFSVRPPSDEPTPRPTSRIGTALPESRTNWGFTRVERLAGNIALIELSYCADIDFSNPKSAARLAADAALELTRDADAVILDVRRNGGGAPSMVGYIVSAFVEPKANVYNTFYSRDGTQTERPAMTYSTPNTTVPLYVLTSGRTGSAAEAIAFTLQSAKRAQVVGEASGGAANPGRSFKSPQGYEVFIATGSPRNPINGRNWEGTGVAPDVMVKSEQALERAQTLAFEKLLAGSISGPARTDAQWALEAVRATMDPPRPTANDIAGEFGPYTLATIEGAVFARRARWPAMRLIPLQTDLFYFEDNPSRRVAVNREAGKVVAITIANSDGSEQRLQRTP